MSGAQLHERVSIVVRTKDRAIFLARALDDVLAQTFQDWKLYLVNDGGDPAPVDALIAERAESFGDRIVPIHLAENVGRPAAANRAIEQAVGEYIALHDDDDSWADDYLEVVAQKLDRNLDAVAAAVPSEIVHEKVKGDRIVEISRSRYEPAGQQVLLFDLLRANHLTTNGLLIRRSAFEQIGLYDEELRSVEDWELHLRLIRLGQVLFVDGPARAYWHQRPGSIGSHSNSVYGDSDEHFRFDRLVRDRALHQYVDNHGMGALLYLTKYIDERVHYYSIKPSLLRGLRRLLGRRS